MRYCNKNEAQRLLIRIMLLFFSIVCLFYESIQIEELSLYSTIVCFILLFLAYCEKKRVLTEYNIILAFIILFHFGQSIIYLFDPQRYLPIVSEFSRGYVIQALKYSMLCLQLFDIVFSFYNPLVDVKAKYTKESSWNYLRAGASISKILLIILTPVVYVNLILKTAFSLRYGYMNLYAYDGAGYSESAIMPYIQNLFVIACILRITSSSFDKRKSKVPLLLMVVYSVLMFLQGSRSGMLSVLLPALLIYSTKIKKGEKEEKGKIILWAVLLIAGSVFMSYFRLITEKTSVGFSESVSYVIENNPFSTIMIEMGGTLKPVIYCIEIFNGSEPFKYGMSYIASVFLLIPNVGHFLGDIHPAAKLANLSQWLMDYKHLSHGPGFSIIAESYYNFGMFGWIVFIIWAIIFCKILGNTDKQNEERNFISYAAMTLFFSLIRGSTSDFLRMFIYEVIFLNVIVKAFAGTVYGK